MSSVSSPIIVNAIGEVVQSMQDRDICVFYEHGHPKEIVNTLSKKSRGTAQYTKFPLIALFQDIEETKKSLEEKYGTININLEDGTYTEIKKEDE